MSNCIVCKSATSTRSYSASERLRSSHFLIVFKLFNLFEIEFDEEGRLCEDCYMLLDRIDGLGSELRKKTDEFKSRFIQATFNSSKNQKSESIGRVLGSKLCEKTEEPKTRLKQASVSSSKKRKIDSTASPPLKRKSLRIQSMKKPQAKGKDTISTNAIFMTPTPEVEVQSDGSDDPLNEIDESYISSEVLSQQGYSEEDRPKEVIKLQLDYSLEDESNELIDIDHGSEDDLKVLNNSVEDNEVLNPKNIDRNISYVKSKCGKDHLVYQNNRYKKHGLISKGIPQIKWRCVYGNNRQKQRDCRGQINTSQDGTFVYLDTIVEHNHPPKNDDTNKITFQNRLKQIAIDHPEMKPVEVISYLQQQDYPDGIPFELPNKRSIFKFIRRIRKRILGTPDSYTGKLHFHNRLKQLAIEHPHVPTAKLVSEALREYPNGTPFKMPAKASIKRFIDRRKSEVKMKMSLEMGASVSSPDQYN